ncbi:hypothetical protein VOLCADRAFT_108147 [Volvox carteri f. nagariensis]|uniref:Uncharacterized protein n=1 Tax=Volvox carteri f. nagariensis TaxID=3068 RepID=D8UIJ3_VOLCA|nr:uncharacterized protein VOLCADRAFT_108147 [Volvox carteri f. nagariensis]EFJ40485.1 hypothetical protein VOLCADRAFT_108147 [Volvox carteri f. nagariensis]|eukprot:XP_002958485.1 hypothetical protein VOLCADRAFT_108147 [Volvox carteri f. nagariensis]
MVSRTAAEDAVRRVVSGPERGDLLFFIGEQTDDQLSQWRILDTDGDSAIVAFVRRKAQGSLPAAAGEHYHEAVCPMGINKGSVGESRFFNPTVILMSMTNPFHEISCQGTVSEFPLIMI